MIGLAKFCKSIKDPGDAVRNLCLKNAMKERVNYYRFSMRTGNLLLVAMDQDEKDRPRIFISAQLNEQSQTYAGQFMTDFGGN